MTHETWEKEKKINNVKGIIASNANYHICVKWLSQYKDPVLVLSSRYSMNTIEIDLMPTWFILFYVGKCEGTQLVALCRIYTFGLENRLIDVSMSFRLNSNSALARNWLGVSTTNGMFDNLASSLVLPAFVVSEWRKMTNTTLSVCLLYKDGNNLEAAFISLLNWREKNLRMDTILKGLQNLQPFVFLHQYQTRWQMLVLIFKQPVNQFTSHLVY